MDGQSKRRRALVGLSLAVLLAVPQAAFAAEPATAPTGFNEVTGIYEMFFPVIGSVTYSDSFGDCRSGCTRTHEGNDLMGVKMQPVIAVADGTVGGDYSVSGGWFQGEGSCCAMTLEHDDGWSSWYIHLNNDTEGTDDGLGWGFAEGIAPGVHVTAGELIGWVGDSGNAEACNCPHLHFELHDPAGTPVDPYPHLQAAVVLTEPGGEPVDHGLFVDDDGSVHEANINDFAVRGITRGCNPPTNDRFCPTRTLTRGEVAAFLRRFLKLPATETDYFNDDGTSIFEGDINALAEAGIAFGCTETAFCSTAPLRREEMAELLTRTFGYSVPENVDTFVDDDASQFAGSIEAIAAVGVTLGCNPPDNDRFCPQDTLIRAQMASFMMRAIRLQEAQAAG